MNIASHGTVLLKLGAELLLSLQPDLEWSTRHRTEDFNRPSNTAPVNEHDARLAGTTTRHTGHINPRLIAAHHEDTTK